MLLDLELDSSEIRDIWLAALSALVEELRQNPQKAEAHKSMTDRVKESANKQAYFAQRSIQLQQQKRDADARKSKLMQETGGLKYTAMAMANRS